MLVSRLAFEKVAREMLELPIGSKQYSREREKRVFRAAFGTSFEVCSELWSKLEPKKKISRRAQPKHLLWTLIYYKVNISEEMMIKIANCKSCDTFRDWVSKFTDGIADLEEVVIVWANRFNDWDGKCIALVTVDGTDVWMWEPSPRSRIWWSHKHNRAAMRYEIAQCIQTGDIVAINGPFPANLSDREIFDANLSLMLMPGECVEADNGYSGRIQIKTNAVGKDSITRKQKSVARGRHENVNRRLKIFKVMERWESTNTEKHGKIARAVAVIVQLSFENGARLYPVKYEVTYD
ncbi:unnamed protein product [Cylindrotheca closterium]|uniref:DDE Tnp4 domain-containing protein n=1 Tax=Cylindrotheca closterium TaxID=2856 RepID=A0AAD2FUW3_9STRA|nr:unnamed protein product [Cylindrotheca closterium]